MSWLVTQATHDWSKTCGCVKSSVLKLFKHLLTYAYLVLSLSHLCIKLLIHTHNSNQSKLEKVRVCDLLVLVWCNQHCGQYSALCTLAFIFLSSVYTSSFSENQQHHLKQACGCSALQAQKCLLLLLFVQHFSEWVCVNSTTDCRLSSWPLYINKQLRIQFSLWTQAHLFMSSQRWDTLIWSLLMQV